MNKIKRKLLVSRQWVENIINIVWRKIDSYKIKYTY